MKGKDWGHLDLGLFIGLCFDEVLIGRGLLTLLMRADSFVLLFPLHRGIFPSEEIALDGVHGVMAFTHRLCIVHKSKVRWV